MKGKDHFRKLIIHLEYQMQKLSLKCLSHFVPKANSNV